MSTKTERCSENQDRGWKMTKKRPESFYVEHPKACFPPRSEFRKEPSDLVDIDNMKKDRCLFVEIRIFLAETT